MITERNFVRLAKQLYPTGRAWILKKTSTFHKFHEALAVSENNYYQALQGILNSILPDNDNFSEEDAENWERALGMYINPDVSLNDRKLAILRKIKHPGDIPARQHYLYIEGQLRDAGFDVYVHKNIVPASNPPVVFNPIVPIYGGFNYAGNVYGNTGSTYTLIANHVDEILDENYSIGGYDNLRATFFIGGATWQSYANVPIERKGEFRELILKLKPAQTVGFLLINYI
jgi:hypothetical protein